MSASPSLKRTLFRLVLFVGLILWLTALVLFTQVVENSDDFARLHTWILLINSAGIIVLVFLIGISLTRLIRDLRSHKPGAHLRLRISGLLVALAVTPLVIIYLFSVEFINHGLDSWFSGDVKRGLDNAMTLSRTAFDLEKRRGLNEVQRIGERLSDASGGTAALIGRLRRNSTASELTLFSQDGRIIATSSDDPATVVPKGPTREILFRLRQDQPYVSLEPVQGGGYEVIAAINIGRPTTNVQRILKARFPVEPSLAVLANSVQASYNQYAELAFLREALKHSATLMLSLVLLIAILGSVYAAFVATRRVIAPILQLMHGTRAVAHGNFNTQLPVPAHHEIGFLVNSFNQMTQRLALARQENLLGEQKVESERRKLEVILAHLSTGVVSLEADMRIRTANSAAGRILNTDLEAHVGESLDGLAEIRPMLKQFVSVSRSRFEKGQSEWREQIELRGDSGRRILMCACTDLPAIEPGVLDGHVLVFDDITALLQAQRDAAWGEVARRLAHEVKNPLTPIQLSAERLRRRYLEADTSDNFQVLDRSTRTIIDQVEAMKDMVNAFSQYAMSPAAEMARINLNDIVSGVAELYQGHNPSRYIALSLDSNIPDITGDADRIRQVLHNLIRNALEATEQQNDVRIEIVTHYIEKAESVGIVVTDNGPGFVSNVMDQAFDPYVTSKTKGTGLGLAIVKKLVEEHGGQITARNCKHRGAEISILIPAFGGEVRASARPNENRRERA